MSKPGKGMDTWDIVKAMTDVEPDPSKMAYFRAKNGRHLLIGRVLIDDDGDLIMEESE
jgi:hypothetical protein